MDFYKVKNAILKFRDERDWKQFHNPKDLATAISIEAGELQEKFLRRTQTESYEIGKNNSEVMEEFADIFNCLVLFAEECNIDIEKVVLDKLEKNAIKYPISKSKGRCDKYTQL